MTAAVRQQVAGNQWADAELVWEYHRLNHMPKFCSAAVALGCNDLGVATHAAELYHSGLFSIVVFSGANSRDTVARFPRGEGVHYREHALELGVPETAILVEPEATNTGENITLSRRVLADAGVTVDSLMLISMPYMERRAFATARKVWPEVELVCTSTPVTLEEYVESIDDGLDVIDMMVGDLQRVIEYPGLGFAIEQAVPPMVRSAYQRLVDAGFDAHLL